MRNIPVTQLLSLTIVLASAIGCADSPRGGYVFNRDCKTEAGLHLYIREPSPVKGYTYVDTRTFGVDGEGHLVAGSAEPFNGSLSVQTPDPQIGVNYVDFPAVFGPKTFWFARNLPGEPGVYRLYRAAENDPNCLAAVTNTVRQLREGAHWSEAMISYLFFEKGQCEAMRRIGDLSALRLEKVFLFSERTDSSEDAKIGISRSQYRLWDRDLGTLGTSITLQVRGFYGDVGLNQCAGPPRDRDGDIRAMLGLATHRTALSTKPQ